MRQSLDRAKEEDSSSSWKSFRCRFDDGLNFSLARGVLSFVSSSGLRKGDRSAGSVQALMGGRNEVQANRATGTKEVVSKEVVSKETSSREGRKRLWEKKIEGKNLNLFFLPCSLLLSFPKNHYTPN